MQTGTTLAAASQDTGPGAVLIQVPGGEEVLGLRTEAVCLACWLSSSSSETRSSLKGVPVGEDVPHSTVSFP